MKKKIGAFREVVTQSAREVSERTAAFCDRVESRTVVIGVSADV